MYILPFFLLFLIWISYSKARTQRKELEQEAAFWQKEEEANATRRKDISLLDYVRIPLDQLPIGIRPQDETLADCEAQILALADEKILNLTGKTNTEIKLAYGAANLPFLDECDQRFTNLARTMQRWGARLYELSLTQEAKCVLAFAVSWGSDIKGSYVLLGRIYREERNEAALEDLKARAGSLHSLMKEPILKALSEL